MAQMVTSVDGAGALHDTAPASSSQRRTWFMELVTPDLPQHHLPVALDMFGELDVAVLQISLDVVVERHEALRTIFVDHDGELIQVIGSPRPLVTLVDAPSRPDLDLRNILREQATAPFDLGRGPLVRVIAVRRAPSVHVLVIVLHHIIVDNLSLGLFMGELAQVYGAISACSFPDLVPPPWQYCDFAIAEARWLTSPLFRARLRQYSEKLGPAVARFDFGPGLDPETADAGANHLITLEPVLLNRLKETARRAGVTLFTVLLAALEIALAPFADGPDFVIAVAVAGRESDGAERVIGPFANIVGLKADIRPGQTLAELLTDVGRQLFDALECENMPWDALVRAINPSRSADAMPFTQVMFSSVEMPAPLRRFGRLPCRPVWIPAPAPPADLFVSASETPGGIMWLGFDSRPARVSSRAVVELSGAFRTELLKIAHEDIAALEVSPRRSGRGADLRSHRDHSAGNVPTFTSLAHDSRAAPGAREDPKELVTELWQKFLGAPPVNVRENFFDAGGDSLLALQLISVLRRRLGRELSLSLMLRDPTVGGFVAALSNRKLGDEAVVRLATGADSRVLFIVGSHSRFPDLAVAMQPGPSVWNLDAYALQEQRLLAGAPMFDSVGAIAAEFRRSVKAIQPRGPYLLAGGCEGGIVAYEMALQFQQEGEEVSLLAQLDTPVRGYFEPTFLAPIRDTGRRLRDCIVRALDPSTSEQKSRPLEHERHERIWAAIWSAVRSYHPARLFEGNVYQFKARPMIGFADVVSGWDSRVTGRVVISRLHGNHATWLKHARSAAVIRATLNAVVPFPAHTAARDIDNE